MACDFTFRHYGEILKTALDQGYEFHTFSSMLGKKTGGKTIVLRHDIDSHQYRIGDFAAQEERLGVRATYFFRVHTAYNVFEYSNYRRMHDIDSAGHEVGLHTELGDFLKMNPGADALGLLRREKAFLEAALGHPIAGMSPHRDMDYQVNTLPILDSIDWKSLGFRYHAYQQPFHGGATMYLSETLNPHIAWRESCPCKMLGKSSTVCLMTHPRWWFNEHPREGEQS